MGLVGLGQGGYAWLEDKGVGAGGLVGRWHTWVFVSAWEGGSVGQFKVVVRE